MTTDTGANPDWQAWLNQAMRDAGLNPDKDGPKLDTLTGVVTPSMRSNWKNRGGVSPSVVIAVANALNADLLQGLRAAGHGEMAVGIAQGVVKIPPSEREDTRDRIEKRIEDDSEMSATDRRRWLAMYRADLEAVRTRFEASLDLAASQSAKTRAGEG